MPFDLLLPTGVAPGVTSLSFRMAFATLWHPGRSARDFIANMGVAKRSLLRKSKALLTLLSDQDLARKSSLDFPHKPDEQSVSSLKGD